MTKFPFDRFAKDYLKELLSPLGEVEISREVSGEARQVDVYFVPSLQPTLAPEILGLLGRFTSSTCLIEPFHMAVRLPEVRSCLSKLLDICAKLENEGQPESNLPWLWILSPTASSALLEGFHATPDEPNWLPGVYFLPKYQRTAIIAIHQLPVTPDTLWLRLLGKKKVQKQALKEIRELPVNHPLRKNSLLLLANLNATLQAKQNLDREEEELIMELSPLLIQWQEEAIQQGLQQGLQQGIVTGRYQTIESLLKVRFGEVDEQLRSIIESLLQLPLEEFSLLLLQLSRAELLARFGK